VNLSDFPPQGLNPFKIHGRFKLEFVPNLCHEIHYEFEDGPIDKVVQFVQRVMPSLNIFGPREGSVFEFEVWYDLEYWKILKLGWPTGQRPRTRLGPSPWSLWAHAPPCRCVLSPRALCHRRHRSPPMCARRPYHRQVFIEKQPRLTPLHSSPLSALTSAHSSLWSASASTPLSCRSASAPLREAAAVNLRQ
jgi:hypothetical protein